MLADQSSISSFDRFLNYFLPTQFTEPNNFRNEINAWNCIKMNMKMLNQYLRIYATIQFANYLVNIQAVIYLPL